MSNLLRSLRTHFLAPACNTSRFPLYRQRLQPFSLILSHLSPSSKLWRKSCTFSTTWRSPFFAGRSSTINISYLDTFWRTLRNHFLAPTCISSGFLLHLHHLQLQLFGFVTWCHMQLQFLDYGGSLAHLLLHGSPLFCWNELSSSFFTEVHVIELQFQSLLFSRIFTKVQSSTRMQTSF